jgi:16S rRNA (cytosine967-C5)-methyltransferase
VDAPCSGSGTWRRNPDLKWRQQKEGLANLAQQQLSILEAAAFLVRPGGRLVYSTCSLFGIENQDLIATFLERDSHRKLKSNGGFRLATEQEMNGLTHPNGSTLTALGQLKPSEIDCDGFFVCVLTRE